MKQIEKIYCQRCKKKQPWEQRMWCRTCKCCNIILLDENVEKMKNSAKVKSEATDKVTKQRSKK